MTPGLLLRILGLVVIALALLLPGRGQAWAERRVALVIGNSTYQHVTQLPNTVNDATDMADAFERLGFKVRKELDLDYNGLRKALSDFGHEAAGADMATIFFAGHGLEIDNRNYLIPVDAELRSDRDVSFEAMPLDYLLSLVEGATNLGLVLLDACRSNPFAANMEMSSATRSVGRGLSRVEPAGGTLVGYAAKAGTVAADGDGRNSPFTAALLRHLDEPGLDIRILFGKVRDDVLSATGRTQEPFVYGSLGGDAVFLAPPGAQETARSEPIIQSSTEEDPSFELEYWSSVKNSNDPALMQSYLDNYPNGQFSGLARLMIERLNREGQRMAPAEPTPTELAALAPQTETPAEVDKPDEAISPDLVVRVQKELDRVGCDPGGADGIWGEGSKRALRNFSQHGKVGLAARDPSPELLELLGKFEGRVCPAETKTKTAAKPKSASEPKPAAKSGSNAPAAAPATSGGAKANYVGRGGQSAMRTRCQNGNIDACVVVCRSGGQRACEKAKRAGRM